MNFGGIDDFRCQLFKRSNWKVHMNSCFKSFVKNNSERCLGCEGFVHTIDECPTNLIKNLNKLASHVSSLSDSDSGKEVFYAAI